MLHATPSRMGLLNAAELAPFVAFSLPAGVWPDRIRKRPVDVLGLCIVSLLLANVLLTWYLGYPRSIGIAGLASMHICHAGAPY